MAHVAPVCICTLTEKARMHRIGLPCCPAARAATGDQPCGCAYCTLMAQGYTPECANDRHERYCRVEWGFDMGESCTCPCHQQPSPQQEAN